MSNPFSKETVNYALYARAFMCSPAELEQQRAANDALAANDAPRLDPYRLRRFTTSMNEDHLREMIEIALRSCAKNFVKQDAITVLLQAYWDMPSKDLMDMSDSAVMRAFAALSYAFNDE